MIVPPLAEVRAWTGVSVGSISDDQLTGILQAEQADQAAACVIPDTDAPALTQALLCRVARSCARKGIPLGVMTGLGDGGFGTARPAALDPDIARLEAPHRRLTAG